RGVRAAIAASIRLLRVMERGQSCSFPSEYDDRVPHSEIAERTQSHESAIQGHAPADTERTQSQESEISGSAYSGARWVRAADSRARIVFSAASLDSMPPMLRNRPSGPNWRVS